MNDQAFETPKGMMTTRTLAMPGDANPAGDIFGGWVLAQMDIAGGICAREYAMGRVVTVALDGMSFIQPVKVGDVLGVYTEVIKVGTSSMQVHVEAWVNREKHGGRVKVTEACFKFVALDDAGKSTAVTPLPNAS